MASASFIISAYHRESVQTLKSCYKTKAGNDPFPASAALFKGEFSILLTARIKKLFVIKKGIAVFLQLPYSGQNVQQGFFVTPYNLTTRLTPPS